MPLFTTTKRIRSMDSVLQDHLGYAMSTRATDRQGTVLEDQAHHSENYLPDIPKALRQDVKLRDPTA